MENFINVFLITLPMILFIAPLAVIYVLAWCVIEIKKLKKARK